MHGIVILACTAAIGGGCADRSTVRSAAVDIQGHRFTLQIADDDRSRATGLMGVMRIEPDGGMLFVFPDEAVRWFWMGYCLIDIDLVFLDDRGRVTALHRMKAEPPRGADESDPAYRARLPEYSSHAPARYALELAPGTIDLLGIETGDRIVMPGGNGGTQGDARPQSGRTGS